VLLALTQAAPLIYYKSAQQFTDIFGSDILIPLGLSYYTLRSVHYLLEAYKGTLRDHRLINVAEYMFFLPTIIAGPIHRFPDFYQDQERRRWNPEMFSEGLERILYGYAKITILANVVVNGWFMQAIYTFPPEAPVTFYLTMIAKGLNGYLQFAGYSDVAIGFARLLGFRVMENFNSPLIRQNVQAFWSSWHMSLTSWCREYVYVPIFSLTRARWFGILGAMATLGLWHEFSLRYLAWGLYNGSGIVFWHVWRRVAGERLAAWARKNRFTAGGLAVVSNLITLHFIFIGFTLVQNQSLEGAITFMGKMFGVSG